MSWGACELNYWDCSKRCLVVAWGGACRVAAGAGFGDAFFRRNFADRNKCAIATDDSMFLAPTWRNPSQARRALTFSQGRLALQEALQETVTVSRRILFVHPRALPAEYRCLFRFRFLDTKFSPQPPPALFSAPSPLPHTAKFECLRYFCHQANPFPTQKLLSRWRRHRVPAKSALFGTRCTGVVM